MISGLTFCVDGGGTRSRGCIVDGAGKRLVEAQDGPCNPATDHARALKSFLDLWRRCAAAIGRGAEQTGDVTLALGCAGIYVRPVREAFIAACPPFGRVVAVSDGYAALVGAGGGAPCGMLECGTGVVANRLYADGRSFQRDGWGWVGGDRGSGAWLGRKALRHALSAEDGLIPKDAMSRRVIAALTRENGRISEFLMAIGPDRLAGLAPLVLEAAAAGDPLAVRWRERAIEHLAALVGVLDLGAHDPLYFVGGLSANYGQDLARRLGRTLQAPAADALAGCYLVAQGMAPEEFAAQPGEAPAAAS